MKLSPAQTALLDAVAHGWIIEGFNPARDARPDRDQRITVRQPTLAVLRASGLVRRVATPAADRSSIRRHDWVLTPAGRDAWRASQPGAAGARP